MTAPAAHISDFDTFRIAAEYAPTHIIFTDTDGKIFYANPAAEKITGYSKEEMIGKRPDLWGHIMPPTFYKKLWETIKVKQEVFHGTLTNKRKDGTLYDAEMWIAPVVNGHGLQGFVGVETDITEQKKSAELLQKQKAEFEELITNIDEIFFSFDGSTLKPSYVSPLFEKIFGLPMEDAYNGKWLERVKPEDRDRIQTIITGDRVETDLEFHIARTDGSERTLLAHTSPLSKDGKITGAVGTIHDVTEQRKTMAELQELHGLQSRILEILSHQLRTPLSAIRWNLEMMTDPAFGTLNEAQRGFTRMTHIMITEIIHRLGDMFILLNIQQGMVVFDKQPANLEALVSSALHDFHRQSSKKEIEIKFHPPSPALPLVKIDSGRLRRTIGRLIDNAISYTPEKGHVEIKLSKAADMVRFEITDNGIGIPQTEQERIFNKFFRASNAQSMKADASGVGLYIAKFMIESHGGQIGFTSKEAMGSTFWFTLPIHHS